MALSEKTINAYTEILCSELKPALGCTEPIAIAYCAAIAARALGARPERYEASCSGSIIKNTMAVTVPQTGGLRGIEAAVLAGALGGDPDRQLEVLSGITPEKIREIRAETEKKNVSVKLLDTAEQLQVIVECHKGKDWARAGLKGTHTGIYLIMRNGEVLLDKKEDQAAAPAADYSELNIRDILAYGDEVGLDQVREVIERQISYNSAISEAGIKGSWGAEVGKTLIEGSGNEKSRLIAAAAAGSDARMNGCALPVIINSGSGNQGMAVSLPVIEYARLHGISRDRLIRALCVSNLTSIRQKRDIGRLSAYCGAVCAATGSAVGIAYLEGAGYEVVAQTIDNALGTISGMLCDGAKSSCAAKIAGALDCALLGYEMAKKERGFRSGEGLIKDNVEKTITGFGKVASRGMDKTNVEVLNVMIDKGEDNETGN